LQHIDPKSKTCPVTQTNDPMGILKVLIQLLGKLEVGPVTQTNDPMGILKAA